MRPVLFLNLEGVCHPLEVSYAFRSGQVDVGAVPFSWIEPLRAVAESWDISVVLRSAATAVHSVEAMQKLAPAWLQERIVGSTSDVIRFISLDRVRKVNTAFGVVKRYVDEHEIRHWLVLSDDDDGWPALARSRQHLVLCDSQRGLTEPAVIARLEAAFIACAP